MFFYAVFFSFVSPALADAPYEKYYVNPTDIEPAVLKDIIGVLTVTIPGSLDDFRKHNNGIMTLGGKEWLFVSDIENIDTYTSLAGTFHADGKLPRAEKHPKDEWLCESWDGESSMKFPIVNSQGDYRQILYDPLKKLTIWVKPSGIPKPYAYLFVPEVEKIAYYTYESGSFIADGSLNLTDVVPISGWSWNGYISERIVTVRFPIIEAKGEYRHIVYNPLIGLAMWVHFPTMEKAFEPRAGYEIKEVYFTEEYFNQNKSSPIYVELFFLSQTRELYHAPDESAHFDLISPYVQDPNSPGKSNFDQGYITRIQNGFAHISDIDIVTGDERRIGWIKIRDKDERLTVWPDILPSY